MRRLIPRESSSELIMRDSKVCLSGQYRWSSSSMLKRYFFYYYLDEGPMNRSSHVKGLSFPSFILILVSSVSMKGFHPVGHGPLKARVWIRLSSSEILFYFDVPTRGAGYPFGTKFVLISFRGKGMRAPIYINIKDFYLVYKCVRPVWTSWSSRF